MKKLGIMLSMLVVTSLPTWSQGAKSIRITEVMTDNRTSIVDEYGVHRAWVELSNTSFTTYNVRGMFLTTDRRVLDKDMSPEQRRKLMCPLPNNEPRTTLAGKKSVVIFDQASGVEKQEGTGPLHLQLNFVSDRQKADNPHAQSNWIALYDGNAVDLIDSITIPPLQKDQSYALSRNFKTWDICEPGKTTPGYLSQASGLSKPQMLKKTDPYGIGITILSMGIVFSCLALLFIFFWAFGAYMTHKQQKKTETTQDNAAPQEKPETEDIDKETYIAVISLALREYLENKHDIESGVITIKPKQTRWNTTKF